MQFAGGIEFSHSEMAMSGLSLLQKDSAHAVMDSDCYLSTMQESFKKGGKSILDPRLQLLRF